jgi:hypothetical protein
MRNQATVKVMFPDGLREVPAYMQLFDHGNPFRCRGGLTPEDMEGWEFHRILGRDYEWVAHADRRPINPEPYHFTADEPRWGYHEHP